MPRLRGLGVKSSTVINIMCFWLDAMIFHYTLVGFNNLAIQNRIGNFHFFYGVSRTPNAIVFNDELFNSLACII